MGLHNQFGILPASNATRGERGVSTSSIRVDGNILADIGVGPPNLLPTCSSPDVHETQQIPTLSLSVPQMATPTTSSHVYPVPSRPPMTSNQATAELNKLLSELEEARNRYNRLLPQTVGAQVDMERSEAKVKEFYVAHGLML